MIPPTQLCGHLPRKFSPGVGNHSWTGKSQGCIVHSPAGTTGRIPEPEPDSHRRVFGKVQPAVGTGEDTEV